MFKRGDKLVALSSVQMISLKKFNNDKVPKIIKEQVYTFIEDSRKLMNEIFLEEISYSWPKKFFMLKSDYDFKKKLDRIINE